MASFRIVVKVGYPGSTRTFELLAGGLARADPEVLRTVTDEAIRWCENPKLSVTLVVNGEIYSKGERTIELPELG